ncbi:MAG: MMPL family transporter [Pseudomonadales bacterium]|nr:MMPL family transporter [Pseudomonadales bacterium]
MKANLVRLTLQYRWVLFILSLLLIATSVTGFANFKFDASVRSFFADDYVYYKEFIEFEELYGEEQVAMIMLSPGDDVASPEFLQHLMVLTQKAWTLPYVGRVNSIANYQHTYAADDELIVEDLLPQDQDISAEFAQKALAIAVNEPSLVNKLISQDGKHVAIVLNFHFPSGAQETNVEIADALYAFIDEFEKDYKAQTGKQIETAMTGNLISIYHNIQIGKHDFGVMVPLMFLLMFVMLGIIMKTVSGTLIALFIAVLSTLGAFAFASMAGITFAMMTFNAVIIIITITIAHCIHIIKHFQLLSVDHSKREALQGSLDINALPVTLTSVTTLMGFLSLNFSQLPPVVTLGNVAAIGVVLCWIFSFTVLPALMLLLPFRHKATASDVAHPMMEKTADFVIKNKFPILIGSCLFAALMIVLSLQNILNDRFSELIEKPHPFRTANDKVDQHFGALYEINLSIDSGTANGITSPEYLASVDAVSSWLRTQPEVKSVTAVTDIFKRLNVNLHNNDEAYYKIPASQELAAQYLLLYEMSLPFGLDLNNQISFDKQESRIMITFSSMDTRDVFEFADRLTQWQAENLPEVHRATPTSIAVMWAHLSYDSLASSIKSSLMALVLISAIMILALKSFKYGIISLVPNVFPTAIGFGIWYLINGEINMGLTSVMIITIGIVVDDTVHFLSKYKHASEVLGQTAEQAVHYAFNTVGAAIIITTMVLVTGFSLLILSQSVSNTGLGILTGLILFSAVLMDFFLLPVLLLYVDRDKT